MTEKLTPKQERFVAEYLVDLNATQAAIRAGYSAKTARSIGHELLTKPDIQDAITTGRATLAEKTGITQERVLKEYARLGFLDIRKAFDENGHLKPISELDDDTAAAIAGIDIVENQCGAEISADGIRTVESYTKKLKIADKKGALDSIARHLGMFNDSLTLKGRLTLTHEEALEQLDKPDDAAGA
jgi:phage terminase small subunit